MIYLNNIAAVVVTYNRLNMLQKCLSAIKNQTVGCDIIIINNNSSDGTEEWVKENIISESGIIYRNTHQNIGGSGGFNTGMRIAVEKGYEYVWIMDDDCIPCLDALETLIKAGEIIGRGNFGYLSSVVLWKDGTECKMNRQKIKKTYYNYSHLLKHGIIQVEQSTFVSLLFSSEVIKNVGLPVKEFFIWGDDIEYTRRIAVRNGIPSFMVCGSQVVHEMAKNNGSNIVIDGLDRIGRYKFTFRNESYLYRKEGVKGALFYFAKCGVYFFRILFKSPNYKLKRLGVLIGSMIKGIFFNPKIEYIQEDKNG